MGHLSRVVQALARPLPEAGRARANLAPLPPVVGDGDRLARSSPTCWTTRSSTHPKGTGAGKGQVVNAQPSRGAATPHTPAGQSGPAAARPVGWRSASPIPARIPPGLRASSSVFTRLTRRAPRARSGLGWRLPKRLWKRTGTHRRRERRGTGDTLHRAAAGGSGR